MFDSFEHGQHNNRRGNYSRLLQKRCISKYVIFHRCGTYIPNTPNEGKQVLSIREFIRS